MESNEMKMKVKGESKIWASITKADGKAKDISSTQLGQQILFDEVLRIQEDFEKWISKCNKADRLVLRDLFHDDDIKYSKLWFKSLLDSAF